MLVTLLAAGLPQAQAHPLAPALLDLRELAPGHYAVLWRTSVARVQGTEVRPLLPVDCRPLTGKQQSLEENQSQVLRWQMDCGAQGLSGRELAVTGLERSGISVILRIEPLHGAVTTRLLDVQQPAFVVPPAQVPPPVFSGYFRLGVEHLLLGFDHVLFVLGLLLLLRRPHPNPHPQAGEGTIVFLPHPFAGEGRGGGLPLLLLTITAFTIGHSITLALATLGIVQVNQTITELGIALSILVLACELAAPADAPRGLLARRPALMALAFGLLHGLGFAGALAELGLPRGDIPLALFSFNLGIEAGQLLLILAVLPMLALARRMAQPRFAHALPVYVIGSLAAMWCLERAMELRP